MCRCTFSVLRRCEDYVTRVQVSDPDFLSVSLFVCQSKDYTLLELWVVSLSKLSLICR